MPKNEQSNWRRDILVIPLIVGLLVAVGTYFLPKLFEKAKKLTYSIEGPTPYVNTTALPGVSINLNGVQVSSLYGYRIRLWNSGGASITKLPVQCRFSPTSADFKILNVKHETIPKQEFGKIDEEGSDDVSKRFVYELLNPNDEDTITLVTNQEVPLAFFSKAEGLQVDQQKTEEPLGFKSYATTIIALISVLSSLLTIIFRQLGERAKKDGSDIVKPK